MQGLSIKDSLSIKHSYEYYYERLERLFFIRDGEIIGRYNDGSSLFDFFYEPANGNTVRDIIFEIKRLINTYEKNLTISAISAGFFPTNGSLLLLIEIECYFDGILEKQTLTFSKMRD
jgi:hypothetical protein